MIPPWKIEIEEKPTTEDIRFLLGRLQDYNVAMSPTPFERRDLRLFLRDASGNIQAGLLGSITMHCLVIQILWVDEVLRGKGIGTELVGKAEEMARLDGAKQAIVETTTFQAPAFYEHRGYVCICEIPDCPIGATSLLMRKWL